MSIQKVGVLGAGTMGAGIAQVCVESGYSVVMVDIVAGVADKALAGIKKNWGKAAEKGKLDAAAIDKYTAALSVGTELALLKDVDIVIEAVLELIEIKKTVMKQLDELCSPNTILASNTSALSITEIATATNRIDKVLGMHFFNPVPVMKLVEIIPGLGTSDDTFNAVFELCQKIGKEPVKAKEVPGFIVNRLLVPYLIEAAFAYQEGVASAEEIDKAMKLGANMPIGPLALIDMVGVDICLNISDYFFKEFGDSKYRAPVVLRQKVRAGHLGMKTGIGFYNYKK